MRRAVSGLLAFAAFSVIFVRAIEAEAKEAEEPYGSTGHEDTIGRRRPVSITLNLLGPIVERYGGNIEIAPVPHHAFILSGYVQAIPLWMLRGVVPVELRENSPPAPGGEFGYRLYSGTRGANGLFIGASVVLMPLVYARLADDSSLSSPAVELKKFYTVGGAIDVGVQGITDFGLTLGAGLGAQYIDYELPTDSNRIAAPALHVLPRVLLSAGYSF